MKSKRWMILLAFALAAGLITSPINAADPTADDLVAAVNAFRAAYGYYALNPHPLVYQAAQAHAEWIVATGQGGHIGADGSDETVRVSWTGYGNGAKIQCDENWASGRTINDTVYVAWSDAIHQGVMLDRWGNGYTDVGGGVASYGDGRFVFILNVCKVVGQESGEEVPNVPNQGTPPAIPPTPDYSNFITDVITATPQADGSVTHIVKYGQTLLTIAQAYGITVEQLRELNGFAPDFIAIWPDDELIIRQGTGQGLPSATPDQGTPEATLTPTVTPRPTYTPSSLELTATAAASLTTEQPVQKPERSALTAGMFLLIFTGFGLVAVVFVISLKKDNQPPDEDIF